MVQRNGGGRSGGKVREEVRALFSPNICTIDRETCGILAETKREWWDDACRVCEKTRTEHLPQPSAWTKHILRLRFEIEDCQIPYGVDDLSPDEWQGLGTVRQELRAMEGERAAQARLKHPLTSHLPLRPG